MRRILFLDIVSIIIFISITILGFYTNYSIPDYIVLPICFINLALIFLSGYLTFVIRFGNSLIKILNIIFIILYLFIFGVLYLYILLAFLVLAVIVGLIIFFIRKNKD